MPEILERLKQGIHAFHKDTYPALAEHYQHAAAVPQTPHTLVITCADSRINIESVTNSLPGQLFITRNVGNMVPDYGEMMGGVSAVIEYAVAALKVKHIVICGHSDCGAMKALLNPSSLESLPAVKNWLSNADEAVSATEGSSGDAASSGDRLAHLTERNVLLQLQHLHKHPSVAAAIKSGELTLSGWVYDIGTGDVRIAEEGQETFSNIECSPQAALDAVEGTATARASA